MKSILAALLMLFAFSLPRAAEPSPTIERGREMTTLFLQGKLDAVWERMAPAMRQAFGGEAKLKTFRDQVGEQIGEEAEILEERTLRTQGVDVYLRVGRWTKAERIQVQWAFDGSGRVAGFFVKPDSAAPKAAPSKYLDYQTRAPLRLPFTGEWYVFWGGRTPEQNYHVINRQQRFAYDFLVVREGVSHRGTGRSVEDFFCWDQPILAPAKGTVVERVDGLPDQSPGTMDPAHAAGNHVVLDLGNGEYALLAHLRRGSLRVQEGERVEAGQVLGACGNSGNTTEPHLHFHLQDAPRFGEGDGLPAFFSNYVADGQPVERGEPVKGQRVAPR